jgi:hypothetical protein
MTQTHERKDVTQFTKEFLEFWSRYCEMYLFAEEVASEKQIAFKKFIARLLELGSITYETASQLEGETV